MVLVGTANGKLQLYNASDSKLLFELPTTTATTSTSSMMSMASSSKAATGVVGECSSPIKRIKWHIDGVHLGNSGCSHCLVANDGDCPSIQLEV